MNRQRIILGCAACFMLLLFAALAGFNHLKPRLVILHTFSEDGHWEQLFNEGVHRALERNRKPIAVSWHYMNFSDTEAQSDAEWAAAATRARSVISLWQPKVLLIVGEEGQEWVGRHYVSTDPNDRGIVYATGEDPQRFGYTADTNVTGVHEILPLAQILEILTQLNTAPLRVQALGIADPTGEFERHQVLAMDWQPHQLLSVKLVDDYEQWRAAVQHAANQADVLLVLSSGGLRRSKSSSMPVSSEELISWTARNSKPLAIGVRESFVKNGGLLTVAPSAEAFGNQAATLALQALADGPLPAPRDSLDFVVGMRPAQLAARGYTLPSIYLQAARAVHLLYPDP